jgi:phage terminase Nu1 subunit (DNA packaging protein)
MSTQPRWVNLKQLASETGLETRTLQYIRKREPGVLVTRSVGKDIEYKQPDCAVALRLREAKKASKSSDKVDDLRNRRFDAETRLAELELAEAEGKVIPISDYESRLAAICERVANVLKTVPSKYLGRIQVARTQIEAQAVGESIRDETLIALQGVGEDLDDDIEDVDEQDVA